MTDTKISLAISTAKVKALALQHGLITTASAAIDTEPPLPILLDENPPLREAWERGEFLHRLRNEARTTATVSEAGRHLGMAGPDLRELLDGDTEARAAWDRERQCLRRTMAEALVEQVRQGNRNACRHVERFLRHEEPEASCDFAHVPVSIMTRIAGRSRQTLHTWTSDLGCPRNPDGTFNLTDFVAWYGRYEANREANSPIRSQVQAAIRTEFHRLAQTFLTEPSAASQQGDG